MKQNASSLYRGMGLYREEHLMLSPLPLALLFRLFRRYFLLLTGLVALLTLYCTESYTLSSEKGLLLTRRAELLANIKRAKEARKGLEEELSSASDLHWQELTLIRQLGVVPQGWKKVIINP